MNLNALPDVLWWLCCVISLCDKNGYKGKMESVSVRRMHIPQLESTHIDFVYIAQVRSTASLEYSGLAYIFKTGSYFINFYLWIRTSIRIWVNSIQMTENG